MVVWDVQTFDDEQVEPAAHVPHESVPPQPLEIVPHVLPWAAQVVGVQLGTHTLPVPQTRPVPQAPHARVLPQPSDTVPQFLP